MELNLATKESISWAELLDHEIIVVESLPSPHLTSVTLAPGMRFEALSASSGQVLMAHARPGVAEQVLARSTPLARKRAGVDDMAGLSRLLERVRGQGYALTEKAFDQDSLSISAPVFDVQGRAVGAINLSTLRARFDRKEALATLVPAVMAAAKVVSQSL
jgi:IclR family pca regulon transcriptional regulator